MPQMGEKRTVGEDTRIWNGGGWVHETPGTVENQPETFWGGATRHFMEKEGAAKNALLGGAALATGPLAAPLSVAAPFVGRGMGKLSELLGTGHTTAPTGGELATDAVEGALSGYGGAALNKVGKVAGAVGDAARNASSHFGPAAGFIDKLLNWKTRALLSKPVTNAVQTLGSNVSPKGIQSAFGSVKDFGEEMVDTLRHGFNAKGGSQITPQRVIRPKAEIPYRAPKELPGRVDANMPNKSGFDPNAPMGEPAAQFHQPPGMDRYTPNKSGFEGPVEGLQSGVPTPYGVPDAGTPASAAATMGRLSGQKAPTLNGSLEDAINGLRGEVAPSPLGNTPLRPHVGRVGDAHVASTPEMSSGEMNMARDSPYGNGSVMQTGMKPAEYADQAMEGLHGANADYNYDGVLEMQMPRQSTVPEFTSEGGNLAHPEVPGLTVDTSQYAAPVKGLRDAGQHAVEMPNMEMNAPAPQETPQLPESWKQFAGEPKTIAPAPEDAAFADRLMKDPATRWDNLEGPPQTPFDDALNELRAQSEAAGWPELNSPYGRDPSSGRRLTSTSPLRK